MQVSHPAQFGLRGGYPLRGSVVLDERGKRVERQPGEEAEAYCLSVMHQIHCLVSFLRYLPYITFTLYVKLGLTTGIFDFLFFTLTDVCCLLTDVCRSC